MFVSTIIQAQVPTIKWWSEIFDSSFGQSASGDIDNDGKLEIVFGCYRNDSNIYALNGEDGSLLWKFNAHGSAEGCNDVAVALFDIDNDDSLEVIVPSSCNPKTYCFRGKTGAIQWQTNSAGSDSPPTIADIDNDGKPEILHGGFDGHVLCLNAENGSVAWSKSVFNNSWVQTAPTIVDVNNDGKLDFVVGTWAFNPDTNKMYAFDGATQNLIWSKAVSDHIYHGTAVADLDNDSKPELVVGDYSGMLHVLNGEDGSTLWTYQASVYIGAPASIADLDKDGNCEVVFCDGYGVGALSNTGTLEWYYAIPNFGQTFRGVAIANINNDNMLDIVFGTNTGHVIVLNGTDGSLIWDLDLQAHIGKTFDVNHAPLVADFDQNGKIDIFVVGGKTDYPNFQTNYGRAYMIEAGDGNGPEWLMFQHDILRKSTLCDAPLSNSSIKKGDSNIKIFPNPVAIILQVQSNVSGTLELNNLFGTSVLTKQIAEPNSTIDISLLPKGIYLLRFKTIDQIFHYKIVKE